jgi:hypothetical protein
MILSDNPKFLTLVGHVKKWEGTLSKDPRDTAASCVQPGQVHTNRGVTFCAFKSLAAKLGITPVTYNRFISMGDKDAAKFLYEYYKAVGGPKINNPELALAMTEANWGSGPTRAQKHLIDALRNLGYTVKDTNQAFELANKAPIVKLYEEYQRLRRYYLEVTLGSSPKYAWAKQGWINRINDFNKLFQPAAGIFVGPLALLAFFFRDTLGIK